MGFLRPIAFLFLSVLLAFPSGTAVAQTVPTSRAQLTYSFAPIVKQVAPAVVNIYTRRVVETRTSPFMNDPFFQQFFGPDFNFGVPQQRVQSSLGSGVVLRPDGLIVTNNHVIKDSDQITVVLNDKREFPAKVLLADERIDLALLKIDVGSAHLPTLSLADSDELQVGDLVLAIGDPFGVGQTVTSGIISALARTQVGIADYGFFIQTDAAINPGNSGGALVTMDGKLAGINTAIYSRSGGSVGIGFAIPANMVQAFLAAQGSGGHIKRPWIGVSGQGVSSDMAEALGLDHPTGIVVSDIYPGGPGQQAGIKQGDVLLAINGKAIDDPGTLRFRLATMSLGSEATLTILRNHQQMTVPVKLLSAPENPPAQRTLLKGQQPLAGATAANLSPALADELQLDSDWRGVVIVEIRRGTTAYRFGFASGDIITSINGQPVTTVAELQTALANADHWEIKLKRAGETKTLRIQ